jgi:hypothetical protein
VILKALYYGGRSIAPSSYALFDHRKSQATKTKEGDKTNRGERPRKNRVISSRALDSVNRRIKQPSSADGAEIPALAVDHDFETVAAYDMVAG